MSSSKAERQGKADPKESRQESAATAKASPGKKPQASAKADTSAKANVSKQSSAPKQTADSKEDADASKARTSAQASAQAGKAQETQGKQTLGFQSEAKQLLHLMIHSLYSNKEIFLRELISNANDAIDKLRFRALSDPSLLPDAASGAGKDGPSAEVADAGDTGVTDVDGSGAETDGAEVKGAEVKGAEVTGVESPGTEATGKEQLHIKVDADPEAKTLTVSDNGIGMTREEAIANLGTIAKSGTSQFLESLTGDQQKDAQLIGQFGVGFYSCFIVASKVVVESRAADSSPDEAVRWTSTGEAEFEVETIRKEGKGTSVTLHLKPDEAEFADTWRLDAIIRKYADHVAVPVLMKKPDLPDASTTSDSSDVTGASDQNPSEASKGSQEDKEGEGAQQDKQPESKWEPVNTAKALWTRPRQEVSEEEYQEFYKLVSHDWEAPLAWSHNKVEGKLEYTSLLYVPRKAPFDLFNREHPRGLKLYVQRVFILDQVDQFLPMYLRFVRGVVDSSDLSLNVSRELLQKDPAIDTMRAALTKRVLDMLGKLSVEDYQLFWDEFGQVLKEGVAEDFSNKEAIAKLLRFATTNSDAPTQDQPLADYVGRMKEGQDKIYFVAADSWHTAANSPHLEIFRKQGIEVLLLHDRIDEWLLGHLSEFDGKPFEDVARGNLDLGSLMDESAKQAQEAAAKESESLVNRVKTLLEEKVGDQVQDVRVTSRLTDSPACLVVTEDDMGMQMRRVLESAGQAVPDSKRVFELNPQHPLVQKLNDEQDDERFSNLALVLFDQAKLAEGTQLDEPATYINRLNKLLLELSA